MSSRGSSSTHDRVGGAPNRASRRESNVQQVGKSRLSRGKSAIGVLCASAAMLAIPASVLALSSDSDGNSLLAFEGFDSFTPASVDPRLAELVAERSNGLSRSMRFTPAADPNRGERSVTVAVRIDEKAARAISVRAPIASSGGVSGSAPKVASSSGIQITPTRYDLGVARGYRSFAGLAKTATPQSSKLPNSARAVELDKFDGFKLSDEKTKKPSRFNARIELDEAKPAGRAPGTLAAEGNQSVDVSGSYSVTKNLDVTAGVRYSQERDAIQKLPEEVQDQQSVYVGTQFRF